MRNKPYPLYEIPPITDLKDMIKKRAENTPDNIAFCFSKHKKIYNKTCLEFSRDIDALGTYLYNKGYKNKHIAIIGENSYEWLVSFFAIVNGGNVAVPIDKELPLEKINKLLYQSDCKAAFASKKYIKIAKELCVNEILTLSDTDEFCNEGNNILSGGNREFVEHKIDIQKMSVIAFTSGTTGGTKGVMLSQSNIVSDINNGSCNFILEGGTIAVLPLNHMFGLVVGTMMVFNYNQSIYICSNIKRFVEELKNAKPQTLFLVPLFVETFYKQIWTTARRNRKEKTLLITMKLSNILLNKMGVDLRKQLFSSIRNALGGNLKYILCGGAALDKKYYTAFRTWGIEILGAYGITECSPGIAVNRNFHHKDSSAGLPIKKCNVKISDEGEILVKGDNVMLGYYKDEESTNQVLNNGWYSTGDIGHIDDDGFLFITGRKKNLIILSNGENVSPEELEAPILLDEAVSEAIVYGENGILAVQIYPTEEYMGNEEYFENLIAEFNKKQPQYMRINKIVLRKTEFIKNSTKKILRHKIMEE